MIWKEARKSGRMEDRKTGRLEDWKAGRLEGRTSGELQNGGLAKRIALDAIVAPRAGLPSVEKISRGLGYL